ncbi:hypothetical protein [Tuberibacillus calidus]|uniref:hypothetical protein n=1 Tax=Tuberibacillus calidus TaxID=340097 RepID=UPI000488F74E|nr:hypothetical protein [Tuberibacillus calidus]
MKLRLSKLKYFILALILPLFLLVSPKAFAATDSSSASQNLQISNTSESYFNVISPSVMNGIDPKFLILPFSVVPSGGGGECSGWKYVSGNDGSELAFCSFHDGREIITDLEEITTWPMSDLTTSFTWTECHKVFPVRRNLSSRSRNPFFL